MERESQTEPEAATVTPLDQALWSVLTAEPAPAASASAMPEPAGVIPVSGLPPRGSRQDGVAGSDGPAC